MSADLFEQMLRQARVEQFASGFSTRVVQRTRALRDRTLGAVLQRYFVWIVPAAVAAIVVLAVYNSRAATAARGFDAMLALPPVTLQAAYALDAHSPGQ